MSGTAGILISTTTNQIIGMMPITPGAPPVSAHTLGFVPNSNKAYFSGGNTVSNNVLQIYDPGANVFNGNVFVGVGAADMDFTQDGSRAYVIRSFNNDAVAVVDTASDVLVDTINLSPDSSPIRIALCTPPPPVVPTLSQWGMIALVGLFAIAAIVFLRRKAFV